MLAARRDLENRVDHGSAARCWRGCLAGSCPARRDRFSAVPVTRITTETRAAPCIIPRATRRRSGIVRAMLPCNTFGRGAAPSAKEACARLVVDRDTTLATRPARPGPSAPQEGQYDFEATISPSGVQASAAFTYPAPSSDAAHTAADGNRTVTPTMPRAQFCLPMSGTYPLASHFRFMAVAANGAADARGR